MADLDGTMVPPAPQITDASGGVWTIGASNAIMRNGVRASGGTGSKILWKGTAIYVLGTDSNWWRWNGSGWSNTGSIQPGGPVPTLAGITIPVRNGALGYQGQYVSVGFAGPEVGSLSFVGQVLTVVQTADKVFAVGDMALWFATRAIVVDVKATAGRVVIVPLEGKVVGQLISAPLAEVQHA